MHPDTPGIKLQDRDFAILRDLFESRVMSLRHVSLLHFDGRTEAAKKRVQRLKSAGLLTERPRSRYEPSILLVTRRAIDLLNTGGLLADFPQLSIPAFERRANVSDLTLQHELQVIDVKAAIVGAIRTCKQCTVAQFSTWPRLYEFTTKHPKSSGYGMADLSIKPDGYIRIQEQEPDGQSEYTFFLELDRSTETLETFADRAAGYGSYYRSGDFARRCGGERSDYEQYPFRVLAVFKTAERRNNVASRFLQNQPPIHSQVWLTTFKEIIDDPLGPVWMRPIDYRDIVMGSPFDIRVAQLNQYGYKRQAERELLVEQRIQKRSLFSD